jgi:hypothetical protein
MATKTTPNQIRANVAAAQALYAGANPRDLEIARRYLGTSKFIGYCQSFVRQVTGGRTSGASAIQAWNNTSQKVQGIQGIQPGDLVYFSPHVSNRGYGHTGVYSGNGQFISATDSGIKQMGILDWIKSTGQKLLGYVPAVERALGLRGQQNSQTNLESGNQQSSQTNQMSFGFLTPQQAVSHNVQMRQQGLTSRVPVPMPPIPQVRSTIELDPRKMNRGSSLAQNA